MIITLVIDQYGEENNGTTMTARRFASVLRSHNNEVLKQYNQNYKTL